jgi:hypothetical protein
MERKLNFIPGLLNFFQQFKGHIFFIGPLYRADFPVICDFLPNFEYFSYKVMVHQEKVEKA